MDAASPAPSGMLSALLDDALDPLFWRPGRLGHDSAWTAHVPFAHWIVGAARPRMLVELGTHNGVSYSAFCEAVIRARLDTRCYAVDTWEGDEHAGMYGEEVFSDLNRFHAQHYQSFSELLRCTFDAALGYIPDGSIDLLHIDGLHSYDAVRHDFGTWLPKLSERAVVLFHDTNVRERGFGVWQLFAELRQRWPAFEFLHEHGLGVLAVGDDAPEDVAGLCRLTDPATIHAVRDRFSQLGERWRFEVSLRRLGTALDARNRQSESLEAERDAVRREAKSIARMRIRAAQQATEARRTAAVAFAELNRLQLDHERITRERDGMVAERDQAIAHRDDIANARAKLTQTLSWRVTAPFRRIGQRIPARVSDGSALALRLAWWAARGRLRAGLAQRALLRYRLQQLLASGYFDAAWYRRRYSDVGGSGLDPAEHFVARGAAEGRNPGPRFDAAAYLRQHPDVVASGMTALVHYLEYGATEGREMFAVDDIAPGLPATTAPAVATLPRAGTGTKLRIAFIVGEPGTPGAVYRVDRAARAAEASGARTLSIPYTEAAARRAEILDSDIVVIWRTAWDDNVVAVLDAAHATGAKLVFDIDDLMIEPDLATVAVIDGIRTQHIPEDAVRGHYARTRDTMANCDFCLATTDELAWYMRRHAKPTLVIPNGFDRETLRHSRLIARRRRQQPGDGLVRIGYALGSRTHQRDFAQAAGAVACILAEHPDCRLVLFTSHIDAAPLLDLAEFPALAAHAAQIEWRETVALAKLPDEVGRFDVNLAPLEIGNPFCEAKSELKYFEAALVGVVTVASPTGPFRRCIVPGRTGFLAATPDDWHAALTTLIGDAGLRQRIARAALLDVLWPFGPECRAEMMASALDQVRGGVAAARAFALDTRRTTAPRSAPTLPDGEVVFETDKLGSAEVTVIVPLYNYAQHVEAALESVRAQTLAPLDLVVVDDCSTDASLSVARAWAERAAHRFNRVTVIRNRANAGLGATRNAGFAAAETPYVLPVDADNRLLPTCCETLLRHAATNAAAFTYPIIQEFGERDALMGIFPYTPARLIGVPHIDAMALVSVAAWACVGGYGPSRLGWEDYEFWCRLAEFGLNGAQVPGAPLAEYRVHSTSLLKSVTESVAIKPRVVADMMRRHPWLSLVAARDAALPPPASGANDLAGLTALLPLLRCPETGQELVVEPATGGLRTVDGARRWPVVEGRPVLFPGMAAPQVMPKAHVSNTVPDSALAIMREADGPVLNLSAGGTAERPANVVEAEAAIFRNTGVVADAHHLPFADGVFAAVVALNAFEHYRDPHRAAAEIFRVLRPGGRVLIRTAFLQPLHEAPHHYYNCTRYGLEAWFAAFDTEHLHVSDNFSPGHTLAWFANEARTALRRDVSPDAAIAFAATPIGHLADLWSDPAAFAADRAVVDLQRLPQTSQDIIAAGFEYVGRRPGNANG